MDEQQMKDLALQDTSLRLITTPTRELNKKELKPLYKFYLKNEIAYTEDHIPVQKLHLFGMPMELTQDALLDYFTQSYGQSVGIERIEDSLRADEEPEYLPTWSAFALFANARDATKVLQTSEHAVSIYKFHVQACYSWLQPLNVEESNDLEFAITPNILRLNDDCLEYVFQYLSLADHIRLARTCTRFRTIYQRISARHHKSVYTSEIDDLTLWETRDFCQLSGHFVNNLSCRGESLSYINENFMRCFYSGLHFPNLKKLYLHDYQLKVHKLQRILTRASRLKELTLMTEPRTDRLELAQLKELKRLRISEWNTESLSLPTSIETLILNSWQTSSCLSSILKNHTQIKKLKVSWSSNVFKEMSKSKAFASVEVLQIIHSGFHVKELIAQMPKLKKLGVYCEFWDRDGICEFLKHNPRQLDYLEIDTNEEVRKGDMLLITGLVGLHTLVLSYADQIDDEVISQFYKLTELKRLGLHSSMITDSSLLQLMINCPKLSTLRMEGCHKVSDNLLYSIITLVRKDIQSGKNQRELPFKLFLWECESVKETLFFRNIIETNSDVVDVIFGYSKLSKWFDEELDFIQETIWLKTTRFEL